MITAISGVIASGISSVPPFDPDAQAFFNAETAAGGTFSTHQLSFAYIADSLTSTELTALRTINLTFQTTLGRNV